MSVEESSVD